MSGGINLYAYVQNDPINYIDPEGKNPLVGAVIIAVYYVLTNPDAGNTPVAANDPTDASYGAAKIVGEGAADIVGAAALSKIKALLKVLKAAKNRKLCEADPGKLRLPPARDGADPFKLADQMKKYGDSTEGMTPIQVTRGADGELMINNGVTRATRIDTYNQINNTRQTVPVEIIEITKDAFSKLPTIRNP